MIWGGKKTRRKKMQPLLKFRSHKRWSGRKKGGKQRSRSRATDHFYVKTAVRQKKVKRGKGGRFVSSPTLLLQKPCHARAEK